MPAMNANDINVTIESDTSAFEVALAQLAGLVGANEIKKVLADPRQLFTIDASVVDGVIKAVWKPSEYLNNLIAGMKVFNEHARAG